MIIEKYRLIPLFICLVSAMNISAVEVEIHFPPSGSTLDAGDQTFVAGCIKPANSRLSINGRKITAYRTGSFVYMQRINDGKNVLKIESGKYKKEHYFFLKKTAPEKPNPAIEPIFPKESSGILTGTTFTVSCKAPKDSDACVKIGERTIHLKAESSGEIWSKTLKFYCPLNNLPVIFSAKKLPDVNGGLLSALATPSLFKVTGELFSTRARAEPDSGETVAFLKPDDIIISDGYTGKYRTININEKKCFVKESYLKQVILPKGIEPNRQPADITEGFGPHPPKHKHNNQILIAIDAGHGGDDSGATGPSGLKEKEVTLRQAKLLEKVLKNAGYKTMLTRDRDIFKGLYERVQKGYEKKADAFISIHYNSCPSNQNPVDKRHIATYAWNEIGKALADPISSKLAEISPARNIGVKYGNFAVCRNPAIPSVLIELDFISTPEGEELIQTAEFQSKAANAILAGIQAWHK